MTRPLRRSTFQRMSRLLAEIAIPKNPNVQDKFEVTVNNVANHPANFEAFDFDETVQMAKTYLDGVVPLQAQAESQLGGVNGVMKIEKLYKRWDYVVHFSY